MLRFAIPIIILLALGKACFTIDLGIGRQRPLSFDGLSEELDQTLVAATLDEPIPEHKNAIWCAAFPAAWKALEELAGGPVLLAPPAPMAEELNAAPDPRPDVTPETLYTAAGWNDAGIVETIREDIGAKFPDASEPEFPGIAENSFVAYAYLAAEVPFPKPYFQNHEALTFTDSSGVRTNIHSFGLRQKDKDGHLELREQARLLFTSGARGSEDEEFAIDLCADSTPNQIVVARIERQATLGAAVDYVDAQVARISALRDSPFEEHTRLIERLDDMERAKFSREVYGSEKIGPNDQLLVPDLFWRITHHFSPLEGTRFANQKLKGQPIDVARQDIHFRLSRRGARLRAEVKSYYRSGPSDYLLDRPFLIYMKKRGAAKPFFALWVDNAELLQAFGG